MDEHVMQKDPMEILSQWLDEASASEPHDHDAAAFATQGLASDFSDSSSIIPNIGTPNIGIPNIRMVLVRHIDARGLVFFSHQNSVKGQEIQKAAFGALCFHWKSLRKQVRVRGVIDKVSDKESDDYFSQRPFLHQINAIISRQSQTLDNRQTFLDTFERAQSEYAEKDASVKRPAYWGGYRLIPLEIEFWESAPSRLHDRFRFKRSLGDGDDDDWGAWDVKRLYP